MNGMVLLVLAGFQIKHLIADYILQFNWMVSEKGDLTKLGGYAHAGMHVLGSLIVLVIAQVPVIAVIGLLIGEFVIHYTLDYAKVFYSRDVSSESNPRRYWALHGFDQFLHHMTYIGMTFVVMLVK